MKKHIILFFLLVNYFITWSQEFVKTTTPCTKELLQKIPGKWIKVKDNLYAKISKQQQQEILNSLDTIHRWVDKLYSPFYGIDVMWYRHISNTEDFATEYKYERSPNAGFRGIKVNGVPVINYFYSAQFREFNCGREPYEYRRGPGEDGSILHISANILTAIFRTGTLGEMAEVMQIEGRPIQMMCPLTGKWKGYDVYSPEVGSSLRIILLHRKGMLPYIPVTRKQYLDRCIAYIPKLFTTDPKAFELIPDKKERDEQVKKNEKLKDEVLKHYRDEIETSTKAGLLDSPAIIPSYMCNISNTPIFSTEAEGGEMLVTENPAYIRKDLPKQIPQFFVFTFGKYDWWFPPQPDPCKVIEQNFPIEKLQAMIDK